MPMDIIILGWSVAFLLAHILIQATIGAQKVGFEYAAGPRDARVEVGIPARRAKRALFNFLETYPAFIALVLALVVTKHGTHVTTQAEWTWLVARVIYVPLYLYGIPYLRTLAWLVSFAALAVMLSTLMGWYNF